MAATPGWLRIPAPTIETLPIRSSVSSRSQISSRSSASVAVCRSPGSTVNDRSAFWSADTGSFWMIMSTFTLAPARAPKICAATPGSSRTPVSVTRASSAWVTAVTEGLSIVSFSETTRVPGPSSNELRQWIGISWFRAYSTERSWSTLAPEAAISSISSNETTWSRRASGTRRGSALNTPRTSV